MFQLSHEPIWSSDLVTAYFAGLEDGWEAMLVNAVAATDGETFSLHPGVTGVKCKLACLKNIANELCCKLASKSQESVVCHVSDSTDVDLAKMMHTRNLTELNDWLESHWVGQVIADRRLTTFFQPIVCNKSPNVFGYECLMRGLEADQQIISPLRLISAARQSGRLEALDELARVVAIENAAKLGLDDVVFFINFSPRYMTRRIPGMQETVDAALDSGISTDRFVFEITESDEIDDIDFVIEVLDLLREAGFRIALDDIGAGYNSLTRLADIQPDFVKIDMDLIRGVNHDPFKSCITSKLLELSRELNISTIVEGVETANEWQWAQEHGADYAQGFYFAKPSARAVATPIDVHAQV